MHAVQTFIDGVTVTTDTTCSFNAAENQVACSITFTDSRSGAGTGSQTTRWPSRGDIIDEVNVNPPLSRASGTTTVTSTGGFSLTTTATNGFDAQKRPTSTVVVTPTPAGQITSNTTFTAPESAGRPTAATTILTSPGGTQTFTEAISYDSANRTVTRSGGLNRCTVTYDQNANITKEQLHLHHRIDHRGDGAIDAANLPVRGSITVG